jgi:hypothetical protein
MSTETVTYHADIDLSCGCTKRPRDIRYEQIPAIHDEAECLTHGQVEVVHTTALST